VAPGQIVQVRVLEVDIEQKRISLSMKKEGSVSDTAKGRGAQGGQNAKGGRPGKPGQKRPAATVDQLAAKFKKEGKQKQNNVKLQFSLKSIMRSGR
jgi:uncharacterized protein